MKSVFSKQSAEGFAPAIMMIFLMSVAAVGIGLYVFGQRTALPVQEPAPNQSAIGGNRDEHGCLGSAGYSWCQAKNQCIRSWERYCTAAQGKTVVFSCDTGKTITATFYPADDKFVDLALSDGRDMSVPHAMSGSGARYAKPDESFVFWNKGDTAFVTEGASGTETYSNCSMRAN